LKIHNLLLGLGVAAALTLACAVPTPSDASAGTAGDAPAAAAAQGEVKTYTHEAGGITFDVPPGWKAEPDGAQLTVSPEDDSVGVVFWVTEEEDFEHAAKALGVELGKQVKNLKIDDEPKVNTHNGMQHAAVTGSGQVGGHDVLFSADLLQAKKPFIVLTFGSEESLKKHAAEYSQLVKSIKQVG
jgi:predicted Zn-dependent protease